MLRYSVSMRTKPEEAVSEHRRRARQSIDADKKAQTIEPVALCLSLAGIHRHHIGSAVWAGGIVQILGEFGISADSARVALSRLVARGIISRERRGRLSFYQMSESAQRDFTDGDRRIASFGRDLDSSAGYSVVWHAIPESAKGERMRLGARLRFIGFGALQDSTWVALRDRCAEAHAIVDRLGLNDHCSIMGGTFGEHFNAQLIARRGWNIPGLTHRYRTFLEDFDSRNAPTAPADVFAFRVRMTHCFRFFPAADPELPGIDDELDSLRQEVVSLFHENDSKLRNMSEKYFAGVVNPT